MKNIRITPKLPENRRMQSFLRAFGIECVPKFIHTGSLKGCWRLYNPSYRWTSEYADLLNDAGFTWIDGRPLTGREGNGGMFSVFVRGHNELLNDHALAGCCAMGLCGPEAAQAARDAEKQPAAQPYYDPTKECRGECAGCQIPREEMPCQYERPYHVQWTYRRHDGGMVEVLEESRVICFWAAPMHRPERADRHEALAKMICNDHNARI